MRNNVYMQTIGGKLGQYGANEHSEPPILTFDDHSDTIIRETFGDAKAQVFGISRYLAFRKNINR